MPISSGRPMNRARMWRRVWIRFVWILAAASVAVVALGWREGRIAMPFWIERLVGHIATESGNGLKVEVCAPGSLRLASTVVTFQFENAATGAPIDVGQVRFEMSLITPAEVLHMVSIVHPVPDKAGRYAATVIPDGPGIWTATVSYQGPHGQGLFAFPVTVAASK